MIIEQEGDQLHVKRPNDEPQNRALHGLTRTLLHNMVEGVEKGFSKTLEVNGVGYRVEKKGSDLVMNLGFSHQVIVPEVPGITIDVPNPNQIVISGPDKQQVGQFAAEVREKRPRSRIRARVSNIPTRSSAARLVRPVRRSKGGVPKWLKDPIRMHSV